MISFKETLHFLNFLTKTSVSHRANLTKLLLMARIQSRNGKGGIKENCYSQLFTPLTIMQ